MCHGPRLSPEEPQTWVPSQSDPNAPRTEPQERPRTAAFCPQQLAASSPGVPPRAILPPLRVVGRAPALDFIAFGHEENRRHCGCRLPAARSSDKRFSLWARQVSLETSGGSILATVGSAQ